MSAYTKGDSFLINEELGNDNSLYDQVWYDLTIVKEGELLTYFIDGKRESYWIVPESTQ